MSTFNVSRRNFREHYKSFKITESKQVSHFELCIPLFIDCIEPCHNNMGSFSNKMSQFSDDMMLVTTLS